MSQSNAAPPSASPTLLPDLLAFLRPAAFAVGIGLLVGAVGVAFHYGIDLATHLRQLHPCLLYTSRCV